MEQGFVKPTNSFNELVAAMKRVLHYLTSLIMYSVILILILVGIAFIAYYVDVQINAANGFVKPPLISAYTIVSPSMVPTIDVRDVIITKRVEVDNVDIGDVVTFTSADPLYKGVTITHRVVGFVESSSGETMLRTKGDNNNAEDSALVGSDELIGKVVLIIPFIGYIQELLSNMYGWLILIIIPSLIIITIDIVKIAKKIMGKQRVIEKRKSENEE